MKSRLSVITLGVADVTAGAARAGARVVKRAGNTFWGGYAGYFQDPDGHLWEVAFNPFFPLSAQGRIELPS